jgi:SAM-dependent methyltransferase
VKQKLYQRLAAFKSSQKLLSIVAEARCRIFDWRYHINTCGNASLAELTVRGGNVSHGAAYQPTHPKFVFEILKSLDIDYREYAFVDLGSGKGRTLFVAAEFPFQRIVGVEFAEELHQIALKNARDYRSRRQKCTAIECLQLDACEFAIPEVPTVFFLFNPFRPPVLIPVLRNIHKSICDIPRDVILIYVGPFHAHLIEQETKLRQVQESPHHKMYRVTPA